MKKIFYLIAWCALISIAGCRSAKKIQKVITTPIRKDTVQAVVHTDDPKADSIKFIHEVFQKVQSNHIDFKTFSAKVKVHYQGTDGKDEDFEAYLRIQKDSIIWVRINFLLGIEAFGLMITPDSVKVINRLSKVIQLRSVSYLQDITHIPFDFKTLQDLLIGNPIYLDSNIVFYKKEKNGLLLMSIGNIFKNYITLNNDNFMLMHSKLDDVDLLRARTCELTYSDYEPVDNIFFSIYRQISVTEKSGLDIQLNFKQYNFNGPLSFPFKIPKNYKRK
jgi:hypothetical protein